MPKRLLIIGILFCLGGVLAIWQVISDLFHSHINLNFAVFLLPVGIGLLKGKSSSRSWAAFWIVLGYIVCGLMVILAFAFPESAHAYWFDRSVRGSEATPYVVLVAVILSALLAIMHHLLYTPKVTGYINRKTAERQPHYSF